MTPQKKKLVPEKNTKNAINNNFSYNFVTVNEIGMNILMSPKQLSV